MAITMLTAGRRKPKKKYVEQYSYKGNAKTKKAERRLKINMALYIAEYFEALNDSLDFIEERNSAAAERIADIHKEIEDMETAWKRERLGFTFPEHNHQTSIIAYAAHHYYKKELDEQRMKMWRKVKMMAVRRGYKNPELAGTSLLILIAEKLLETTIERLYSGALFDLSQLMGKEMAVYVIGKMADAIRCEGYEKPMDTIINRFQELMNMPDDVIEDIFNNKKVTDLIYKYTTDFHNSFISDEMMEVSKRCMDYGKDNA